MSDKFIDFLIDKGAMVGWYFLYMPVGGDKDTKLMPTRSRRGKDIRATKPFFLIDFWNDAPYVGGCIAAKYYAHIDNNFSEM